MRNAQFSFTLFGIVQLYKGGFTTPFVFPKWLSRVNSVSLQTGGSTPWAGDSVQTPLALL